MSDSVKDKLNKLRKIDKQDLIRYMSQVLKPYRGRLILLLLVNCAVSGVAVGLSGIKKWVVDLAQESQPLSIVITLMVVLSLSSVVVRLIMSVYTTWVTEKTSFSFRRSLFETILKSFWGDRKNTHSEDYLSRMTSDANSVCSNFINIVVTVGGILVELVLAFILLWKYDHSLAILTVAFAPITAAVSILVGLKLRKIQKKIQENPLIIAKKHGLGFMAVGFSFLCLAIVLVLFYKLRGTIDKIGARGAITV
ncbi:MAG: ABC transporter ATP-binding protein, partial [Parasporobacterium sp.]|nr:ABC transporter ATP-binding protein [Parasporobacterium sp.]